MTKFYRIAVVFLSGVLFFGATTHAFDDVKEDSPYFYGVHYLRQQKVLSDGKELHPDSAITKSEFIKYLVQLNTDEKIVPSNVRLPFKDTTDKAAYAPYFQEAILMGILNKEEEKIRPYKKINIIESLELLFHSKGIPIPQKTKVILPYEDLKRNKKALPLIVRALELKLFTPKQKDYIGLYQPLTRGEAIQLIYRMEVATIDLPGRQEEGMNQEENGQLNKFLQAWRLVHKNFYDLSKVDDEKMINAALKGMINTLGDAYSSYLTPDENKSLTEDLSGQVEGIGAYVAVENGKIVIVAPIKNSPAQRAGVKPGDIIKTIDGVSTEGMTLIEAVGKIKGKKGSTVHLTLLRQESVVNVSVTRDVIAINSVETDYIGTDMAHIKLIQFGKNSADEFNKAIEVISNNSAIKGVVLDLRNNPGGFLDAAIAILNNILPIESVAVNVKYTQFNFSQRTTRVGELSKYPLVVLINKGSASASEIVAGAIQDLKLGTLVGETSFGKGTVQEIDYFADQSSLKLTVAQWLTSLGHSIQKVGISPDIVVKNTEGDTQDLQLERATQELRKKIDAR